MGEHGARCGTRATTGAETEGKNRATWGREARCGVRFRCAAAQTDLAVHHTIVQLGRRWATRAATGHQWWRPATKGVFGSLHRVGPHQFMQVIDRLVRCTVALAKPCSCIWPPRVWPDANAGWERSSRARPRSCILAAPSLALRMQFRLHSRLPSSARVTSPPLQCLQSLARDSAAASPLPSSGRYPWAPPSCSPPPGARLQSSLLSLLSPAEVRPADGTPAGYPPLPGPDAPSPLIPPPLPCCA